MVSLSESYFNFVNHTESMDSNSKRSRINCTNSSQEMFKLKGRSTPTNNITPTTRIVYIIPPKIIKTDAANFRSIVEKLTGKDSARSSGPSSTKTRQKKLRSVVSPGKSEPSGLKESDMAEAQIVPDHLWSKRPGVPELLSFEDQHLASCAKVKEECIEEHSIESFDKFSCLSNGDGNLDMFAALIYSDSMQSFSTIDDLKSLNQTDTLSSIFGQSEIDLYQQLPFQ